MHGWKNGWHMHPRATLIDLDCAEMNISRGQLLDYPLGTPGHVAPEIQAHFGPLPIVLEKIPDREDWIREKEDARAAGLPTPSRPSWRKPPVLDIDPAPYDPFSADVWALGRVFESMAKLVTHPLHRQALLDVGARIMLERPSTEVIEARSVSALSCVVRQVQEELDLNGDGQVLFSVGPAAEKFVWKGAKGPDCPFY